MKDCPVLNLYVVVELAGTDSESVWEEFPTFLAARDAVVESVGIHYRDCGYDVMKRLPDGSLTTEF